MKKRKLSIRPIIIAIFIITTIGCYFPGPVYAGQFASRMQNNKQSIPDWAIIIGVVVAIINVIIFVCKMGEEGRSWKKHAFHQQQVQQQQEQNRLFREECDRQGMAFQQQQWDFQNEQFRTQWQDFNRFNDFHQF